jgi:hypothetical protein
MRLIDTTESHQGNALPKHFTLLAFFVVSGLSPFFPQEAHTGPYFNSSEPGCNGSNSSVLVCDDFETPGGAGGRWYAEDCDRASTNGGIGIRTKGWCGNIYRNPITPAGAEVCGTNITPFGMCVGSAGNRANMALHHFKTPTCGSTGAELCNAQEVYVRWYAKWLSGYMFGAEKHMNITNSDGDIAFANVQLNCGFGSAQSTAVPYIQIIHGADVCQGPNISSITLQAGRWYFFEMHVIANATNGTVELWINDCGTGGTSCGSSPILRTRMTGVSLPGNSNGSQIQTVWLENWSNPSSSGTGPYWDQLKVSTNGPIGFMGGGGNSVPPPAPENLRVQ